MNEAHNAGIKLERGKNAARNVVFGGAYRLYAMLAPFVMRTVLLYQLGVDFLGLDSLFASILQVLNLAELGVGSAMVFSMYKPIVEDDRESLCALLNLYRKIYYGIGLVILAAGLAISPLVPTLVKGAVPEGMSLRTLYYMNLGGTVLSYWVFAYKGCLFDAHQRLDVAHKIHLVVDTLKYAVSILLVCVYHNYYLYLIARLGFEIVYNVCRFYFAGRYYPNLKPSGALDPEKKRLILSRVRDLFTARLGGVVMNAADALVISGFLGLHELAVYQNYYFVVSSLRACLEVILSSSLAGIGNSLLTETSEKNYWDFRRLTFLFCWITGLCCCMLMALYQPFMRLWTGEELLMPMSVVVSLVVYLYVVEVNRITNIYKDAAGIWYEDRFRPLTAAVVNVLLNVITVRYIGIFGVIFSTVVAFAAVELPWLILNLFRLVFPRGYAGAYVKSLLWYLSVTAAVCAATYGVCALWSLTLIPTIIVRALISFCLPNLLFLLIYRRTEEFQGSLELADRLTRGKIKLLKRLKADTGGTRA